MTLTDTDLQNIKDIVDFSIKKSELRMDKKFNAIDERFDKIESTIGREVSDLAAMNREFLAKIDNHEERLTKLELQSGLSTE